jgi:hypothetical protein
VTANIPADASNPYVNEASTTCTLVDFPNEPSASDTHSVDLVSPSFSVSKECANEPVPQEGPALWTVVISNDGDVDLDIDADDGIGTFTLLAGTSQTFTVSDAGPFEDIAEVSNTVTATWTLDAELGLTNSDTASASDTCVVGSRVNLLKLTQGIIDPTYDWHFGIYDGPNGPVNGTPGTGSGFLSDPLALDGSGAHPDGVLDFGNLNLDPTKTYTICELNNMASAGWTQEWQVDTDGDGVADTTIPAYNPEEYDSPMANTGYSCVDFGAGTGYPLTPGGTLVFEVNNQFPGGEPRTPGYWKNWSSCSGGSQYVKATGENDLDNEFWTIDELLNDPGFLIGDLQLGGAGTQNADGTSMDCEAAVNILDHRDIDSGKKMSNDAAYDLARNLFAYRLNEAAGACQSPEADQAALEGQALLAGIDFNGTGPHLRPAKGKKNGGIDLYTEALRLSKILDEYNNGLLCDSNP